MTLNIYEWAARWGIPQVALNELRADVGLDAPPANDYSEAAVSQRIMLKSTELGGLLMRNNVGAFQDDSARWVRYGLMNESEQMNQMYKSSDFIGIRPVFITPEMVGTWIGQFWAVEAKEGSWAWGATKHEQAQAKFLYTVKYYGGLGQFCNNAEDLV